MCQRVVVVATAASTVVVHLFFYPDFVVSPPAAPSARVVEAGDDDDDDGGGGTSTDDEPATPETPRKRVETMRRVSRAQFDSDDAHTQAEMSSESEDEPHTGTKVKVCILRMSLLFVHLDSDFEVIDDFIDEPFVVIRRCFQTSTILFTLVSLGTEAATQKGRKRVVFAFNAFDC